MNKLSLETSPYLLQHASNPVEWYPWGEEAFALAKKADKPIFLSIGYSTCHWCHVMAHESFENKDTAALMNKHFVNIKVDREERPDVDALYMNVVQYLTGSGGWPMSVWLTPDLKPFFGGTYFPPEDRHGRPSFRHVLEQIANLWKSDREKILSSTNNIMDDLKTLIDSTSPTITIPDGNKLANQSLSALSQQYDSQHGGFGRAPKFPMPGYLMFLLSFQNKNASAAPIEMVKHSLHQMSRGGIYDQLGGGFARYSTDEKWLVPHFEKMLYDNAQLIEVMATYLQHNSDEEIRLALEETCFYVKRDMTSLEGGFFSAEDADSEGKEGAFYIWTLKELRDALPEDLFEIGSAYFGVTANGNFLDPHHPEPGKNILTKSMTVDQLAANFHLSETDAQSKILQIKNILFEKRKRRIPPSKDDKVITEWNGLMISGLAKASKIIPQPYILETAKKAADFIWTKMVDPSSHQLYRIWRNGQRKIKGQLRDYAFLIKSFLDLFEITGDPQWLDKAEKLQMVQNELFYDAENGGYHTSEKSADLLIALKDDTDNVIPSGTSVAIKNALILSSLLPQSPFSAPIEKTLKYYGGLMERSPVSMLGVLTSLTQLGEGHRQGVVIGNPTDQITKNLEDVLRSFPHPFHHIYVVSPGKNQETLAKMGSPLGQMTMENNKPTAFVCHNFQCHQPITDPNELKKHLSSH